MKHLSQFVHKMAYGSRFDRERRIGLYLLTNVPDRRFLSRYSTSTTSNLLSTSVMEMDEDDDLGEDDSNMHPWKTLLHIPARASWRISPIRTPLALQEIHEFILKTAGRSKRELLQIQQQIIELHQKLIGRRERERIRTVTNREYSTQEQKRDERILPVSYGPNEVLASVKFRLVPNFFIVRRVLEEARSLVGYQASWQPQRVLDFGIGCGSATVASLDVWNNIEWIHGIDASQSMREAAKLVLEEFIQRDERIANTRVTLSAHLSAERSPPAFDLALFTYTATELPHNGAVLAAAALLWDKLRPNGLFVMIEPGTPDGFSSVRTVRNMLRACCDPDNPDTDNIACHILAPCTHNGPCPLTSLPKEQVRKLQQDIVAENEEAGSDEGPLPDAIAPRHGFCSFIHSMPPKEGESKAEKFSYLVAQKRLVGIEDTVDNRFDHVNLSELLARLHNDHSDQKAVRLTEAETSRLSALYVQSTDDPLGLELLAGDRNRESYARIINPPMKKKGHVLIECCSPPGEIVRYKITKSMSKIAPGIYAGARKSRWGGYWPSGPFGLDETTSRYTSPVAENDSTTGGKS